MVKTLPVLCIVFQLIFVSFARAEVSNATNFDQGWRLWLDPKAAWQDDTLYLPEDVKLANLPVNPPTGGWAVLDDQAGIGVSLPATVEEHYFNKAPARTTGSTSPSDIVAAVVQCGQGKIVLLALPGLMDSFVSSASGKFQPVTAKRLMFNALNQ